MTGINDLPIQLVLSIIEYLRPHIHSIGSSIFWRDGADIVDRWYKRGPIEGEEVASEPQEKSVSSGKWEYVRVKFKLSLFSEETDEDDDTSDEDVNLQSDRGYSTLRSLRQ